MQTLLPVPAHPIRRVVTMIRPDRNLGALHTDPTDSFGPGIAKRRPAGREKYVQHERCRTGPSVLHPTEPWRPATVVRTAG